MLTKVRQWTRASSPRFRRFNRLVTRRVGALETDYLRRGRPLAEARLIFDIGADGVDLRACGREARARFRLSEPSRAIAQGAGPDRCRQGQRGRPPAPGEPDAQRKRGARGYDGSRTGSRRRCFAPRRSGARPAGRAMEEVERLMRAASVEVAAEAPDSADARRCLSAYFGELERASRAASTPARTISARADDLAPPSGLFVLARLDGEAVGCGGLKRTEGCGRDQAGLDRAVRPRHGRRAPGAATLEAAARDMGVRTPSSGHQPGADRGPCALPEGRLPRIARFNDNPYAHHWFEKRL